LPSPSSFGAPLGGWRRGVTLSLPEARDLLRTGAVKSSTVDRFGLDKKCASLGQPSIPAAVQDAFSSASLSSHLWPIRRPIAKIPGDLHQSPWLSCSLVTKSRPSNAYLHRIPSLGRARDWDYSHAVANADLHGLSSSLMRPQSGPKNGLTPASKVLSSSQIVDCDGPEGDRRSSATARLFRAHSSVTPHKE